mgnify:CR=1 FL=1
MTAATAMPRAWHGPAFDAALEVGFEPVGDVALPVFRLRET